MSEQLPSLGKIITRGREPAPEIPKTQSIDLLEKILSLKNPQRIEGFERVKLGNFEMTGQLTSKQIALSFIKDGTPLIIGNFLPKPEDKVTKDLKDIEEMTEYLKDWERLSKLIKEFSLTAENIDKIQFFIGKSVPESEILFVTENLKKLLKNNQTNSTLTEEQFEATAIKHTGSSLIYDPQNNNFLLTALDFLPTKTKIVDKKKFQENPV